MLFEVEFATKENGHFKTIRTELVYALSVSECRQIASEIANQFGKGGIQFFISEFTD
jgi:ribosomal protein S24E